MIDGLKPYATLRESNVGWIGRVPQHWQVQKLKYLTRFHNGLAFKPSEWSDSGVPIIRIQNLNGSHAFNYTNDRGLPDFLRIRQGDLLFSWSGNRGTSFGPYIWNQDFEGYLNQHIFKLDGYSLQLRYFYYLLRAVTSHIEEQTHGIIGLVHITKPELGSVRVPVAPADEQSQIVAFLDYADRRIRNYVRAKQKLIKLLTEEQQSIIWDAVTRGINREARLKPSGVEWLGEIPEHWEVKRAKYLFREVDDRSLDGSEQHLSMSQRLGLVPSELVENKTLVSESYAGGKLCAVGDIVLNRLKAHLGVFALAKYAGVISPDYTVLRPFEQQGADYFERVLRSPGCRHELRVRAQGIVEGFWRLYTDDFYNIRLPVPPVAERLEIIAYCENATAGVNWNIASIEREISLLREYRVRMIADVVTGKLDVREAAGRLPQEELTDQPLDEMEDISQDDSTAEDDELEADEAA
jgi:type I restriction enzyme, S subunit